MSEHTKEPWKYGKELAAHSGEFLISMDTGDRGQGVAIAETRPGSGQEKANAQRIVACVNACSGFTDEELLDTYICERPLRQVMLEYKAECSRLANQRDELLAALKEVIGGGPSDMYGANHEAYAQAESLITRMEEGK